MKNSKKPISENYNIYIWQDLNIYYINVGLQDVKIKNKVVEVGESYYTFIALRKGVPGRSRGMEL